MSVTGILSSLLLGSQAQSVAGQQGQFQQDFQQLGQDLQSGNLSAAQSDFATLQQLAPQSATSQNGNPIASEFKQLSQDLQSGNLSGAQSDYSTLQQDFKNGGAHMHHHHFGGEMSAMNQDLQQLGSALQSGNLSSAQQAYTTLEQQFQQFASGGAQSGSSSQAATPSISIEI